ncbi:MULTISPECIES: helix-turn-helix domain-containing protein [Bacillus cereus group]|uniref:helix-turn-helix domain-containing protein n=1 Tax=Bacillus cereus group TaxID=86661 RepID=UPI000BF74E20|nr:helix-turn-helix transcriptional regulator [Bacillus wiedmannii]PFZ98044.1 transcriptional regulator [Bacillus wiedmannii]
MKRIKIARQRKGISQKELAEKLNITQQAVSYYEKGSRIPDENMLLEISQILTVPVEYLTEETNDPDGWDIWEKNTGYSIEEIQSEIKRIKYANHVVGDESDLQNLISQAVANLAGIGNTDRGIIDEIARDISRLQNELNKKYEDPRKIAKLPSFEGKEGMKIYPATIKSAELIFDDLSAEAYEKAIDVLIKATRDLRKISNDLRLN